jgi:hypothetical protein
VGVKRHGDTPTPGVSGQVGFYFGYAELDFSSPGTKKVIDSVDFWMAGK